MQDAEGRVTSCWSYQHVTGAKTCAVGPHRVVHLLRESSEKGCGLARNAAAAEDRASRPCRDIAHCSDQVRERVEGERLISGLALRAVGLHSVGGLSRAAIDRRGVELEMVQNGVIGNLWSLSYDVVWLRYREMGREWDLHGDWGDAYETREHCPAEGNSTNDGNVQ